MKILLLILMLLPVLIQAQMQIKDQLQTGYSHKEEHKGKFNFMSRHISLAGVYNDSLVFISKGNRFSYRLDTKELLAIDDGKFRYEIAHRHNRLFFYFSKHGDLYMAIEAKKQRFIRKTYFR